MASASELTPDNADVTVVATHLAEVRARLARACADAGRAPEDVRLIAVSKRQPEARIDAALAAGHRTFGENRVQEAQAHWTERRARWPDLELHLIGPLQTNKVRDAVRLADAIHTVDRDRLAAKLAEEMAKQGRRLPCFIEVNTGEEAQKAGVLPAAADAFIERCVAEFDLPIVGLMCLPPLEEPPAPHFALLADIAARHGLARLSMGMTADFETAIALGATDVRIGTAVFGPREAP